MAGIGIGSVLDGRYELTAALGQGGAASVFRAWDRQLARAVAVKVLSPDGPLADPDRFRAEAKAMAKLRHPHILEVFGAGVEAGSPYLVLELVTGGNLVDRLDRGRVERTDTIRLARGVLEALHHAHRQGVVHRDVKPANVLLDSEGQPRLSDFGLAKFTGAAKKTATGIILGTPEFMAPEVLKGQEATAASDVYSWGCLVHALVHRRPPHEGTPVEIARAACGVWRPTLMGDPVLDQVLVGSLAADPAKRALAPALLSVLDGGALELPVPPPGHSPGRHEGVQRQRPLPGSSATLQLDRPSTASLAGPLLGPAPAAGRSRARAIATAGAFAALGLSAWLLVGRDGTPSAPGPRPPGPERPGGEARPELVTAWRERLGEMEDLATLLRHLHRDVYGMGEGIEVPRHMAWALLGKEDAAEVSGKLMARLAGLPLRAEFERDRDELRALLGDPKVPFRFRRELHQGLAALRVLDAYFEVWGLEPPYRAQATLDGLFPVAWKKVGKDAVEVPLGPDERLVFAWDVPDDKKAPWILTESEFPSEHERFGAAMWETRTKGAWRIANHLAIEGRVTLTEAEAARGGRLGFVFANLLPSYMFRLAWNDAPIEFHRPPRATSRADWDEHMFPEYEATVGLPPEVLRAGENRLRLTCQPLPGMPPFKGSQVDRVVLALGL